jgi:flagellar hook protein FlgE
MPVLGYPIGEDGKTDTSHLDEVSLDYGLSAAPKFSENVSMDGNLSAEKPAGETVVMSHQIYDEQGEAHSFLVTFTKTANPNEWDYQIEYDGELTPPPFATTNGTFTFNTDGRFDPTPTIALDWDANYVSGGPSVSFDLENITQYSGPDSALVRDQDGYTFGRLVGYNINDRGMVSLNFSNGQIQNVAQLAVASVDNPNGLNSMGQNTYVLTAESGELHLGRAGQEFATSIVSGSLEMSNVDLAQEFTEMIVSQRGYQASARVITTSDEILQETVSLKR